MKVIDISMTIHGNMETYPGDAAPRITRITGEQYNVSKIILGTHTGTHVDPPLHYINDGIGIDRLPLDMLVGPARILDVSNIDSPINPADIGSLEKNEIILLKGSEGGARLTKKGAQYLVKKNIKSVGTDALSMGASGEEYEVHTILLGSGIVIIEGLDLSNVEAGKYFFICLPLKIADGDGGPARAVLISELNKEVSGI